MKNINNRAHKFDEFYDAMFNKKFLDIKQEE